MFLSWNTTNALETNQKEPTSSDLFHLGILWVMFEAGQLVSVSDKQAGELAHTQGFGKSYTQEALPTFLLMISALQEQV